MNMKWTSIIDGDLSGIPQQKISYLRYLTKGTMKTMSLLVGF